jgi:hypothetical protein
MLCYNFLGYGTILSIFNYKVMWGMIKCVTVTRVNEVKKVFITVVRRWPRMRHPMIVYLTASLILFLLMVGSCRAPDVTPTQNPEPEPISAPTPTPTPATLLLKVIEPPDKSSTSADSITVRGQTEAGAVVHVNDEVNVADEQGYFSITIDLYDGPNVIKVSSSNEAGANATVTLTVNLVQ